MDRSIRPGVLLTAGRATAFAVAFATPLVLARIFTQAEFGTYKQIVLLSATIGAIAQLGMADSLLYFLPSASGRGGRYVLNALVVLAVSGLGCAIFLALGGALLAGWLGNPALSGLSGLLGAYLLFLLPATVLEITLTARKRYAAAGLTYGVSDLVRALAFVIPVIITRRLEALLVGAVVFGALRLGVTLLVVAPTDRRELLVDRAALRGQLGYALPLQLGVALWILAQNLHYYIVAAGVDAAAFAVYAVGCLQIPIVDIVSTPARNLLTLGMREAITADRPRAALELWHDTTRRLAAVFFPMVGFLIVTAHELIPMLFTDRYEASVPILMIWSTIALVLAVQAEGVLAVHGDTRMIAVTHGMQVLLVAALVPALMRPFGLIGAVAGTVVAIGAGKGLMLLRAGHLLRVSFGELLPWRQLGSILGAAAVSALGALLVRTRLDAGLALRMLLTGGTFTAIYLTIAVLSGPHGRATARRLLKEIAAWGFVLTGLAWITTRLNRQKSLVLLYHGVHGGDMDPVLNYDGLHVRAARFERQMRYIAARYRVVPLDQLPMSQHDGGTPHAAITFDDAYGNLHAHAYPVLARLGLTATVFVSTDFLLGRRQPWWDRLAAMVAATSVPEARVDVGAGSHRFPLCTAAQKRSALQILARKLLALPPRQRAAALHDLSETLAVEDRAPETPGPMTADQLRDITAGGISVGSHGCSHDSFLHLDRGTQAAELAESRRVLESVTGRPVRWLAYPHGEFTGETAALAREAGYRGAVTAIEEGLNDGIDDPFAIRRIGVGDDVGFARFIVATSGLRDALKALIGKEARHASSTPLDRRPAVSTAGVVLPARPAEEAGAPD